MFYGGMLNIEFLMLLRKILNMIKEKCLSKNVEGIRNPRDRWAYSEGVY